MRNPLPIKSGLTPRRMAVRLAVAYAAIGTAWVVFSDRLLGALNLPPSAERWVATGKGVAFVLVTTGVIYVLSRMGLTTVLNAQGTAREQELRIRDAYVDVLDAVTGGKLVLVTSEELAEELGESLSEPRALSSGAQLSKAREQIRHVLTREGASADLTDRAVSATGEALNNLLKHAGEGEYELLEKDGLFQIRVADSGPGIDFKLLPKAVVPGFSTAQTLGMGFTIMLQLAERLLVCSEPGSTTLLIEIQEH